MRQHTVAPPITKSHPPIRASRLFHLTGEFRNFTLMLFYVSSSDLLTQLHRTPIANSPAIANIYLSNRSLLCHLPSLSVSRALSLSLPAGLHQNL